MVRTEWLKKAPKTERDRACPHGVEFYDDDDDGTHAERTAWMYEAPQFSMRHVANRFGFWRDVEVG
jgi:uncharacterized protein (DUF427 family)